MTSGWRPTRAFGRATVVGLLLLVMGVLLGRPDVVVVVVPLVAVSLWSIATRPTRAPRATSRVGSHLVRESETTAWQVEVEAVPGLRDVVGHLPGDRWAATVPLHGHVASSAGTAATVAVGVEVRSERWGVRRLGPAQVGAFGDFASFAWQWPQQRTETLPALPTPGAFTSRAGLPHPVGLVGQHRSPRPGSGTELSDIRPFRTGDRLRRIHWPVSLRTGALHVTTTHADQDAEVHLVLDAIRDLGDRDVSRGLRSSLDVAVEAAGAVAAHYLATGDRVGLSVLGGGGFVELPAVGGHHQLARVLLALGRAEESQGTVLEARALRAQLARPVPPGALVVLLSALVSPEPLAHAVRLARSGHDVIVIDTLPPELTVGRVGDDAVLAATLLQDVRTARLVWRLRLLEREREARRCAEAGVPVIAWRGPGSLDAVLRGVRRRARAPRMAVR